MEGRDVLRSKAGAPYGIRPIDDESIALAAMLVREGELVVIPTDTVYGVAADPTNPQAIAKIFSAKHRSAEKSVQVLLPSLDELERFGLSIPAPLDTLARAFCPGGFSPICEADASCPFATVRIDDGAAFARTQGVRVPDSTAAQRILAACGPLATSSANLSGEPSACTAQDAARSLGDAVALYLDGGPTPGACASTVAAADPTAEDGVRILREGTVPAEAVFALLA